LEKAFAGHPLGVSVIGTNDTVGGLTREQMLEYYQARYTPENMLLIVCGNFDRDELLGEVEKHCGAWARGEASRQQPQPRINPGRHVITKDRFQRQTVCLGYDSPSGRDAEGKDVADVAATVLGRPGNSRFFWEIVQKGLAPMAQAFQFDFTDTGLFILYAACDPEKAPTVLGRMREEAERLQEEGPEADEIERVVNQVKTQFALSAETPFTRLVQLAEDMETLGRPRSPDERLAELSRITPDRVKQHLEQWPIRGDGILVSVGPRSELE
jgi:predicted Zn-dependent peptidase